MMASSRSKKTWLLPLGLIIMTFFHASCSTGDGDSSFPPGFENLDTTPPVFSVPIVLIPDATVNAELPELTRFRIIGFGESLGMTSDPEPIERLSPALEYYTRDAQAKVYAPCDLILMKIMDNEAGVGDKELELRSSQDSAYFIYIDHVRDISIKEGDSIKAGQEIGLAGVSPEYRVELQVNYMYVVDPSTVGTTHFCPLDYGTPEFVDAHTAFAPLADWKQKDKIDAGTYTFTKNTMTKLL